MRRLTLVVALLITVAGCGDDDASVFTSSAAAQTTHATPGTSPTSSTTVTTAPSTTAPASTAAPTTTATTTPLPTATNALAAFFAAAADLDEAIRSAAVLFNSEWNETTATAGAASVAAIAALDATTLKPLIPPGLSPALEVAVLAVYADLDSRIAALDGGVRYPGDAEFALLCLAQGGVSADRFDADLAAAQSLAALEPPPTAPADSPIAGVLEVRLVAIHSMNWGCDSCGGVNYTAAFEVDWAAQTLLGGVDFESTFNGTSWDVLIYAC